MERLDTYFDPLTGLRQDTYWDDTGMSPKMVIHTTAELDPLIEVNKASYFDDEKKKAGIKNGMWHIASWSPLDQHKLLKRGYVLERMSKREIERLLSDPEFAHCRATRVTHGI